MHIFLAGAGGAFGRAFIPQALAHGHTITGTTRSPAKAAQLVELGITPVVVDGLDRAAVHAAVAQAAPDLVMHQMTALTTMDFRRAERSSAATNRLRTEGTDHLLDAARAAAVTRAVVQSFTSWPYARTGGPIKGEDDPLDPHPPKQLRTSLAAIRHAEDAGTAFGGTVLRYGGFYGPRTGLAPGGEQWELVRAGKFPLIGDGNGLWSFVHVDDAASATLAAIEQDARGVFNVVDDDPAPVRTWLPALAQAIGAPAPRHVPRFVARLLGEHLVTAMTQSRGASNAKIKAQLGWEPAWPTWRDGFSALAAGATPARVPAA